MTAWKWVQIASLLISSTCTLCAAVFVDRAERRDAHGEAMSWRVVAAVNAVAFVLMGLVMAALP